MNQSVRSSAVCSKCGEWKSLEMFYGHPEHKSGHRRECMDCYSVYNSEREHHGAEGRYVEEPDPLDGYRIVACEKCGWYAFGSERLKEHKRAKHRKKK